MAWPQGCWCPGILWGLAILETSAREFEGLLRTQQFLFLAQPGAVPSAFSHCLLVTTSQPGLLLVASLLISIL